MPLEKLHSLRGPAPGSVIPVSGASRRQVAVGVMIDARLQEGWVLSALRQALAVPDVRLCALAMIRGETGGGLASRLHWVVDRMDHRLRCGNDTLFAPVDVAAELSGVPVLDVIAIPHADHWLVGNRSVAELRDAGADVWLCFCAQAPQSPFPPVCRMGVWGLEIGAQVPASSPWAGAAEVGSRSDITVVQVVDYTQPGRDVVYRACGATVKNSARRNRLLALRKAVTFYGRLLRGSTREGLPFNRPPAKAALPKPGARVVPTTSEVIKLSWRLMTQVLTNRWLAAVMRVQWRIGYYFADENAEAACPAGQLRSLVPPKDHDWADPFIVHHRGRSFIFFEDLPCRMGRAHISAVEVFANGEAGIPRKVLERPYHLSYPFVFAWDDELYMLPETADNGTVELYRCEEFPDRWSLHKVMLENVRAFDATVWHDGSRWWLFVSLAEAGADPSEELHLYWSHSLTGSWVAHRANPIVSDVRHARSAGPLFKREGVLYRPSQDCSVAYGSAVSINRVDVIDTLRYQETPVGRIDPDRKSGMRCLHTFGAAGKLRVVDYQVRRPRWSRT